eukprot:1156899-Pelagomonas_calceolata.AAC.4
MHCLAFADMHCFSVTIREILARLRTCLGSPLGTKVSKHLDGQPPIPNNITIDASGFSHPERMRQRAEAPAQQHMQELAWAVSAAHTLVDEELSTFDDTRTA